MHHASIVRPAPAGSDDEQGILARGGSAEPPRRPAERVYAPVHQRVGATPHVIAVLPRGEALRNFVYSGALELVAEQTDLTVLSVMPNDRIRALLDSRYPCVIPLDTNIEEHELRALDAR